MVVLDNEFWVEADGNQDGEYEVVVPPRPITQPAPLGTLVGMNGFSTSEMDNFEFFDAVLLTQPGAVARVGLNFDLRLATPAPNTPWLGLIGLGNQGFDVGNGRRIPISPDFLAVATFGNASVGMIGVTDANGDASPSIPVPPLPALAGMRLFVGATTLDPAQPFAIGNISNELAFTIQP
jgi:hypothetical protein